MISSDDIQNAVNQLVASLTNGTNLDQVQALAQATSLISTRIKELQPATISELLAQVAAVTAQRDALAVQVAATPAKAISP